jgi:hypothetical protein
MKFATPFTKFLHGAGWKVWWLEEKWKYPVHVCTVGFSMSFMFFEISVARFYYVFFRKRKSLSFKNLKQIGMQRNLITSNTNKHNSHGSGSGKTCSYAKNKGPRLRELRERSSSTRFDPRFMSPWVPPSRSLLAQLIRLSGLRTRPSCLKDSAILSPCSLWILNTQRDRVKPRKSRSWSEEKKMDVWFSLGVSSAFANNSLPL